MRKVKVYSPEFMHGMPPYDYFAIKPKVGRIPIHRTDVGLVILADLIGSRTVVFVKDENGLYTEDPKKRMQLPDSLQKSARRICWTVIRMTWLSSGHAWK